MNKEFNIVENEEFGFKHIYPIPSEIELKEYYEKEYYSKMKEENCSREAKLLYENEERDTELNWVKNTYFTDIDFVLKNIINKSNIKLMDIGCGSGEFIYYMKEKGYSVLGIEPSNDAYEQSKRKDLNVEKCTFEEFIEKNDYKEKFDVINMTGVIELSRNPLKVIDDCRKILYKDGILRIECGNDFSEFQEIAYKKINSNKWWISVPDHINYFNFEAIKNILEHYGFELVYNTGDFPMEMFLLMGYDYVNNKNIGKKCHEARVKFETSLPPELRRSFYESLSKIGIGRKFIVYARLK